MTARTSIAELTAFLDEKFKSDALYKKLHDTSARLSTPNFIPDVGNLYPGLYIDALNKSSAMYDVKGSNNRSVTISTVSGECVIFNNIIVPRDFPENLDPTWCTYTYASSRFLCCMMSGRLQLLEPDEVYKNEDILAVLQFPTNISTLLHMPNTKYEQLKGKGFFEDCKNLVYIAPIPEGYTNLGLAFRNCTKLNCPIFLSNTVNWCAGMLDGCTSFNSPIFTHKLEQVVNSKSPCIYGFSVEPYAKYLTAY